MGLKELQFDYPPLTQNIAKEMRFIIKQLDQVFAAGQFKLETAVEKEVKRPLKHGLTLVGRVDRIDVADLGENRRAMLVLDYKTGHVGGSLPKSIYLGNKLQLPVYASALAEMGMGRIAGAGYLPLTKGYDQDEKRFMFKGFVDQNLKELFPPALINEKSRYYISAETINQLCEHANRMVDDAVERIMAGDVRAYAVDEGTCNFCPVKVLCPHAEGAYRGDGVSASYKTFAEDEL